MDFLSYMTLCRRSDFTPFAETMDFVVLNSVSNLRKAMKWLAPYPTVTCCSTMTMPGAGPWMRLTKPVTGYMTHPVSMKGTKTLMIFSVASVFVPDFVLNMQIPCLVSRIKRKHKAGNYVAGSQQRMMYKCFALILL